MNLTISYNFLFEVKILHHYFLNKGMDNFATMPVNEQAAMMLLYDVRNIFHITPSVQTKKDLERYHCLAKPTANGLIVGIKTETDPGPPKTITPFQPLDDDLLLTFHIHLQDFQLLNYTALPLTDNNGQFYLFSNLKGTQEKSFPSLAAHAQAHTGGGMYMPGDMVVDNPANPSKLYIARVKTTAVPSGSADWLEEKASDGMPMTYAGKKDRCPLVRQQLFYRVKTADIEPEVEIRNALGTLIAVKSDILPGEHRTIQIDLRGLPEGLYALHVESADHTYQDDLQFYLLQQQEVPFAILQLAIKSDDPAYDMLDAQGRLRSPVYDLRFRNRATHWRYVGNQFNASSVTTDPLPLTRFGVIDNVSVPDKDGAPVDDLPNPEVVMIKAEALAVEAEKKFYSEIHIH